MTIRVLLADDHAVMREGLRLILDAQEDMTVVAECTDGREAVEKAKEHQPEAAILDVTMPNLNGIEAIRLIREGSPRTAIIILSMHATAEHVFRALDAGALGYVLKESAGREVVHALREAVAGNKYLSRGITGIVVDDYLHRGGAAPERYPLALLSPREREVLQLVVEGKSSKEVARLIHISSKTVDTYRSRLMQKLGIDDIPGLVRFAIQHGVISSS
jgi:DNA-binding NarL/FixJ family response regulator